MAHHPARHGPGSRPKPGRSVVSGMYSTWLFCHAPLGTNESIEHFPVGRRLAFDGAKGRLWVMCGVCERWNLTPLDERWEAIEECERSFRASRLRVSTDNVGMARLREGTTLVRIGEPQRPELAAWRYGDQFGRRRRRHIGTTTAVVADVAGIVVAVTGIVVAGPVTGLLSGVPSTSSTPGISFGDSARWRASPSEETRTISAGRRSSTSSSSRTRTRVTSSKYRSCAR
jgi:hypothetical protein